MKLFVTAAAGTETAARDELRELGFRGAKADRGGVRLQGDLDAVAQICLTSRISVRVLLEVGRFECPNQDALYAGIERIEWERWLTPERTLAVTAIARQSTLTHTNYIAQRTKDAIVDRQRRREGRRSSVDRRDPDLAVFVHLKRDHAGVFIDASGQSLHRRGWRTHGGEAPLKETLAAAVLRLSGWDRKTPLMDPMCGSGTIPIEADQWARRVPPQRPGRRFGFERWADFDRHAAERVAEMRAAIEREVLASGPEVVGLDADEAAVRRARANASRARSFACFSVAPMSALSCSGGVHLVSNPPYGVRLGADPRLWEDVRQALRRLSEHRVTLLLPEAGAPRDLGPGRPVRSLSLYNGRLRCRLVTFGPRGGSVCG